MRSLSACVILCLLEVLTTTLPAQVLYQETFTNTTGNTNLAESAVGWHTYQGASATDLTSDSIITFLAYQTGNPSTQGGYLAVVNQSLGAGNYATSLAMVETFSSMNVAGSTISWNMGNNSSALTAALMVQVAGSWYVSSTTFISSTPVTTAANFSSASTASVEKSLTFDADSLSWYALSLTAGSSMSLDNTLTSLASSDITGIGLYVTTPNAQVVGRFDTLTITAIPEPTTQLLTSLGLIFACLGARRAGIKLRV